MRGQRIGKIAAALLWGLNADFDAESYPTPGASLRRFNPGLVVIGKHRQLGDAADHWKLGDVAR